MRLTLIFSLFFGFPQYAVASNYGEWLAEAGQIINGFETKKLDHVTDDFDCQGMSLGAQQKPIANGGLSDLVGAINGNTTAFPISSEITGNTALTKTNVSLVRLKTLHAGWRQNGLTQYLSAMKPMRHETPKCSGMEN